MIATRNPSTSTLQQEYDESRGRFLILQSELTWLAAEIHRLEILQAANRHAIEAQAHVVEVAAAKLFRANAKKS